MNTKLAKILLTLALFAFLLPNAGCEPRRGGSYSTSYSGFSFGLDWLPDFGGFDFFDDTVEYDEYEYVEDDDFGFDSFDDFDFFDDGFYDDGFYDDDWKKKNRG
ncbi:MAG: hypothetical protein ACE5EC_10645 [Phycisphaerae bacterium]